MLDLFRSRSALVDQNQISSFLHLPSIHPGAPRHLGKVTGSLRTDGSPAADQAYLCRCTGSTPSGQYLCTGWFSYLYSPDHLAINTERYHPLRCLWIQPADEPHNSKLKIRQQNKVDIWALLQLYSRVTPKDVQAAEGMRYQLNENGRMSHAKIEEQVKPLILDWWQSNNSTTSVLLDKDEIKGCILVGRTVHGCWMRIVTDTLNPNPEYLHKLLQHGLRYVDPSQYPIYIGVRSYHGGMSNLYLNMALHHLQIGRVWSVKYMHGHA